MRCPCGRGTASHSSMVSFAPMHSVLQLVYSTAGFTKDMELNGVGFFIGFLHRLRGEVEILPYLCFLKMGRKGATRCWWRRGAAVERLAAMRKVWTSENG